MGYVFIHQQEEELGCQCLFRFIAIYRLAAEKIAEIVLKKVWEEKSGSNVEPIISKNNFLIILHSTG